jgi:hypothetical protein
LTVLDSAVRVLEQEDGDLALLTAGEVHLQKCLEVIIGHFDFLILNRLGFESTWTE